MNTYCENQVAARLVTCQSCGKDYYMREPHVRCVECRGWPHLGISNPWPAVRRTDVNGNHTDDGD